MKNFSLCPILLCLHFLFILPHAADAQTQKETEDYLGTIRESVLEIDYIKFRTHYMPDEEIIKKFLKENAHKDQELQEMYNFFFSGSDDSREMRYEIEHEIMKQFTKFYKTNPLLFKEQNYHLSEFYIKEEKAEDIRNITGDIYVFNALLIYTSGEKTFFTLIKNLVKYKEQLYFGGFSTSKLQDKEMKDKAILIFNEGRPYDLYDLEYLSETENDDILDTEVMELNATDEVDVSEPAADYAADPVITTKTFNGKIEETEYTFKLEYINNNFIQNITVYFGQEKLDNTYYFQSDEGLIFIYLSFLHKTLHLTQTLNGNLNGSVHDMNNYNVLSTIILYQLVK